MATVADLTLGLGVDPTGLTAGLDRATREVDAFGRKVQGAFQAPRVDLSGASASGANVARAFSDSLGTGLNKAKDDLSAFGTTMRDAFKAPEINTQQVAQVGREAATAFSNSLDSTLESSLKGVSESVSTQAIDTKVFGTRGTDAATNFVGNLKKRIKSGGLTKSEGKEATKGGEAGAGEAGKEAGEKYAKEFKARMSDVLKDLAGSIGKVGLGLSAAITAPLAGLALAATNASAEAGKASLSLRTLTGKNGPELEQLKKTLDDIFSSVPGNMNDLATVLGTLAGRFGGTTEQLTTLTKEVSAVGRIAGTDVPTALRSTTQAFSAWHIGIDSASDSLNFLYKLSSQTTTNMGDLLDTLGHFGPLLRSLGLGFEQSAAFIALLEKNGVDASDVLPRMSQALTNLAKNGADASTVFLHLVEDIKHASSDTEALNLGTRIFGARGAAAFVTAIRSATGSMDQLIENANRSNDSIGATMTSMSSFSGEMQKLAHSMSVALEPLGKALTDAFKNMKPAISAVISDIASMVKWFSELPQWVQKTVIGITAFAAILGPTFLALSGMVKTFLALRTAITAVSTGLALLRGAQAAAAVSATGAAAGVGGLVTTFAALGPYLIPAGIIIAGLAAVAFAIRKSGEEARLAKKRIDDYAESLKTASNQRLTIDTRDAERAIAVLKARQKDLLDQEKIASANLRGADVFRINAQVQDIQKSIDALEKVKNTIGAEQQTRADAARKDAEELAEFNKQVAALIKTAGAGKPVDFTVKLSGQQAKDEIAELQERIATIKKRESDPAHFVVDTRVADQAIAELNARINEIRFGTPLDWDKLLGGANAKTAVQSLGEEVQHLVAGFNLLPVSASKADVSALMQRARDAMRETNTLLAKQKDQFGADAVALKQYQRDLETTFGDQANFFLLDAAKALASFRPTAPSVVPLHLTMDDKEFNARLKALTTEIGKTPIVMHILPASDVRTFTELGKRLAKAQADAQTAALAGNSFTRQANSLADQAKNDLLSALRAFEHEGLRAGLPFEVMEQRLKEVEAILKAAGVDVATIRAFGTVDPMVESLRDAGDAAKRIGDAFNDNVVRAIGAALDALGNFKAGLDQIKSGGFANIAAGLGGIASAVGGAIGIVGSIFSKSPEQQRFESALNENSSRLREMSASLDRFTSTANGTAAAQAGVRALLQPETQAALFSAGPHSIGFDPGELGRIVEDALKGTGATWKQIQALAKEMGFTITDSKGRIDVLLLQDFADALGVSEKKLLDWGKSFDQVKSLDTLMSRALGQTQTPQLALQQSFDAFQKAVGSEKNVNLFTKFFGGITSESLKTAEGQAKLRQGIVDLLTAIENNKLALTDLGDLSSVKDLDPILGTLLDNLDAMSDATKSVTDSLLNVPQGFKVALARFNATAVEEAKKSTIIPPPVVVPPEPPVVVPTPVPSDELAKRGVPTRVTLDKASTTDALTKPLSDALRGIEDTLANGPMASIADAIEELLKGTRTPTSSTTKTSATETDFTGGGFMGELADLVAKTKQESAGDTFVFQAGSIQINGTTLKPEEILDALTRAAQRKARASFGTTTKANDILNL